MVERKLPKLEVAGSNPVSRSRFQNSRVRCSPNRLEWHGSKDDCTDRLFFVSEPLHEVTAPAACALGAVVYCGSRPYTSPLDDGSDGLRRLGLSLDRKYSSDLVLPIHM